MKKLSQKQKVADQLRAHGYVDNFWAIENKISLRLGAIIFTLKKEGYEFDEVRSGFMPSTKNWRYYLLTAVRQPYMPKFRYEDLPGGGKREIAILYDK